MSQNALRSGIVVRDATDADMAAVQAIYAFHVLNGLATFEEAPPEIDEMRTRCRAVEDAGFAWLVAEEDTRIVGYSYAAPYRMRPAYRFTTEDSVYVLETARGRGIGTILLEALIDRCEKGRWRQMLAVIGDSANTASISLHRRLGFRAVGTFAAVGFKFGRWVDTVLMQRELGEGSTSLP